MRVLPKGAVVTSLLLAMLVAPAWAQAQGTPFDVPHGPVKWLPDRDWSGQVLCRYPGAKPRVKTAKTLQALGRVTVVQEVEPNDYFAVAQPISIVPGPMTPINIDVKGTIFNGADVDLYRFNARKGDVLGLAVLSHSSLDPVLAVLQTNELPLIENDNHNGKALYYPPESPLPGGIGLYDSALSWIAPADGDYLIRVTSFASASRGDYTLQIRARRPSVENENLGSTQIIFLDFDGATFNAEAAFYGIGRNPCTLSPMRDFLAGWGLTYQDESAVVEAIANVVQERFDALRLASLNGNLPTDKIAGHYDVQILNSRDHADPWGQPNVSRVIVGGTIDQLGILTIGIAQSIDPGNFAREETAVVLLDLLSFPADDPWGVFNSINSIRLGGGMGIIDVIGEVVGNIVVHEAGHYLGNWHTDNSNDIPCIMDTGGRPIWDMAGAGPDGIFGTGDDVIVEFLADVFDPDEAIAVGEEETDVNTAFALSSGRIEREAPPEVPQWQYPLTSVRATPTSGSPPLRVEFAAGGIDDDIKDLTFTWDFADGSPLAGGPVVSHVFELPGEFLVKVTARNAQGVIGQASVLITTSATLPTASIVASPVRGPAPLMVSFDGRASTSPSGTIIKYEWDLGDGTFASTPTVQHTYRNQGYFAAKLTVTDSFGGTSTASTIITVNAPSGTTADSAQTVPTSSSTVAPQCGLGSGVMMIASLAGLLLISIRRRY